MFDSIVESRVSVILYEVFKRQRSELFPISFIESPSRRAFLWVQNLDHNWKMAAPACILIHPTGEVDKNEVLQRVNSMAE